MCAQVIADYTYAFLPMIFHSIGQKLDNSWLKLPPANSVISL